VLVPIAQMQRFAALRNDGDRTVAHGLALLQQHRAEVERRSPTCRST